MTIRTPSEIKWKEITSNGLGDSYEGRAWIALLPNGYLIRCEFPSGQFGITFVPGMPEYSA